MRRGAASASTAATTTRRTTSCRKPQAAGQLARPAAPLDAQHGRTLPPLASSCEPGHRTKAGRSALQRMAQLPDGCCNHGDDCVWRGMGDALQGSMTQPGLALGSKPLGVQLSTAAEGLGRCYLGCWLGSLGG